MNIVEKMENDLKKEIQRITNYTEIDWQKVFFNGGEIDFHDQEIDISFWYGTYSTSYQFIYDYESNAGALFRIEDDGSSSEVWKR